MHRCGARGGYILAVKDAVDSLRTMFPVAFWGKKKGRTAVCAAILPLSVLCVWVRAPQ